METSQSLLILLYCSCLMLVSITQVNECEIPLLHEFNGTAKENVTSIEVCSTCSTFGSYMTFVVIYSSILSHLNHRRKGACYMLQWLVLEQNFSFFMFRQIPIGRSVIILYFLFFLFIMTLTKKMIPSDASTFTVSQRNSKSSSRRTGVLYCSLSLTVYK